MSFRTIRTGGLIGNPEMAEPVHSDLDIQIPGLLVHSRPGMTAVIRKHSS
jgi:hypothetical protein